MLIETDSNHTAGPSVPVFGALGALALATLLGAAGIAFVVRDD
jgi:hypothetical protein